MSFGTLTDWRSSIAREAESALNRSASPSTGSPSPTLGAANKGAMDEVRLAHSVLQARRAAPAQPRKILPRFNISGLSEDVLHNLNLAWHRLDAGRTCLPGLRDSSAGS
jgi:2-haloacid dehalogenase